MSYTKPYKKLMPVFLLILILVLTTPACGAGATGYVPTATLINECTPERVLQWVDEVDPVFMAFFADAKLAIEEMGKFTKPIDPKVFSDFASRNRSYEETMAGIVPPSCLKQAHERYKAAISYYTKVYESAMENDFETGLRYIELAEAASDEALRLMEENLTPELLKYIP